MRNSSQCCQSKLRFIRQINGNFMHSMVIPEWFVKYFGCKIPETVKLELANGNTYDTEVTESMNRTILHSGWTAFVDANKIEENYSLMFRYRGNARFKVAIFDSNGKEIALCCVGMKATSDVKSPDYNNVDDSSSSHDGTTQSSAGEGSDSDGFPDESSSRYCKSAKMAAVSYTSEDFSEDNPSADESMELDDQMLSKDYILSGQCNLTVGQEGKIQALVAEIQPEIPVLVALMKKTNVGPNTDLVIRKDYALVYFPGENQTITLQVPTKSKEWLCNLRVRPDGGCNLRLGNFVHDNSVKEGDICLFQPMKNVKQRRFTMTVHILREASIDHSPGGRTGKGLNHGRTSTKRAVVKEEPPTDGEDISFSDHEEHGVSESSEGNSVELPDDIVLSGRCYLTEEQEVKIQALVSRIQPEIPVLVVMMKKTSVKQCGNLVIRKDYAVKYFPWENTNIILQVPMKKNTWKCKFHIRPSGVSDAGRRNLSLGNFVRDNNVRVGDICVFQPMTNVKQRRFTLTAHVLHKASIDHSPYRRTGSGSNHGRTGTNITFVKEKPPTNGEESLSSDHEEHGASESSEGASQPPFILPDRIRLTQAQENKVLEKVEEIESELPIYVAIMNKMNVCRRNLSPILNFGVRYATTYLEKKHAGGNHGKKSVISLVFQREGKSSTWATEMRWSTNRASHQLRVLKGWPSFSRANRLQEGDLCLFELMKNREPLKMMVYIIRRDKC